MLNHRSNIKFIRLYTILVYQIANASSTPCSYINIIPKILTASHCKKASAIPDEWKAFMCLSLQSEVADYRDGLESSPGHYSKEQKSN